MVLGGMSLCSNVVAMMWVVCLLLVTPIVMLCLLGSLMVKILLVFSPVIKLGMLVTRLSLGWLSLFMKVGRLCTVLVIWCLGLLVVVVRCLNVSVSFIRGNIGMGVL